MKTEKDDPFNLGLDPSQTRLLRHRLEVAKALQGFDRLPDLPNHSGLSCTWRISEEAAPNTPSRRHRHDFGPFTKIAIAVATWTLAILWVINHRRQ
jgi:hypothetical protein